MRGIVEYVAFCKHCGAPKKVPRYVIRTYWKQTDVIYCDNCKGENTIPEYLKLITEELIKEVKH